MQERTIKMTFSRGSNTSFGQHFVDEAFALPSLHGQNVVQAMLKLTQTMPASVVQLRKMKPTNIIRMYETILIVMRVTEDGETAAVAVDL
jgi:hypothetical protein